MKVLIIGLLVVVAVGASLLEEHEAKFQDFKIKHGKTYKDQAEETKRFGIFQNNLRAIEEHNALYDQGLSTYKQGINEFADMTRDEFKTLLTLSVSQKPHFNATKHIKTGLAIPDSVDWRTEGQVTGVKNQGSCGSCWAFSLTGSIEAAYYRKSGNLVSLSEQQLVDCATDVNFGCSGGYLDMTFPYLQSNGLVSEESYPYTGKDDDCKYASSNVVTKVSGYTSVARDEDNSLLDAVANVGPVSVTLDATYLSSYSSGIYEDNQCTTYNRNHAVLIIGYGEENQNKFWIVKNSWGSWGEQGYFRIARGNNQCGIAEDDVYPTI